jgi:hypothetical protein
MVDSLYLSEHHLYGSSRLGIKSYPDSLLLNVFEASVLTDNISSLRPWYHYGFDNLVDSPKLLPYTGNTSNMFRNKTLRASRTMGLKHYELTDHLGNVNVAILDKKTGTGDGNPGEYAFLSANISSFTDYAPFGSALTGRSGEFSFYRHSYNGQEKDDEVYGKGNLNSAEFWMYDTRIARRWNLDPVKIPFQSQYATYNGNPILNVDYLGNVGEPVVENGNLVIYSTFLFYGNAVSDDLAKQATNNIQSQWNDAQGTVNFNGVTYTDVQFVVTYKIVSEQEAQSRAQKNVGDNYDPRLNFARIEERANLVDGMNRITGEMGKSGDNSFLFVADDIRAGSTSQSHEQGHGFGLWGHVSSFELYTGVPNIMTTIHTLVESDYTIDRIASELLVDPDGRKRVLHPLNTELRKVTQDNIDGLNFNKIKRDGTMINRVGSSSNKLFNAQGEVVDKKSKTIKAN